MPSSCPLVARQLAAPFPVQKPCADIGIRIQGALPTFSAPRPDAGPVRKRPNSRARTPCIGRCARTVTICGLQGCLITGLPDYRVARLQGCPITGLPDYRVTRLRLDHSTTGPNYGFAERQVAGAARRWCQALAAPVVGAGVGLPAPVSREDGGRAGNRPRRSGPAIGTRRGRQTS